MREEVRQEYERKKKTAKQAVSMIKSGKVVFIGTACGEPQLLVRTLSETAESTYDTEVMQTLSLGLVPHKYEEMSENLRMNALFVGPSLRSAVNKGKADYTPVNLSDIGRLFEDKVLPIDYALIQVSPPDVNGYFSLGISVDITKTGADMAKVVIAQVNNQMPRIRGDSFIHISEIDAIVEHDEPLLEWSMPEESDSEVLTSIGKNVASLVTDGCTIQAGFGAVPNAVLAQLCDKRDLGIHTEMFSDGIIDLIQSGAVTGMKKKIHPGMITASFCLGTERLFDYIRKNVDLFEFFPSSYINDPCLIAKHDNMVAINSALEVDITGQVCADQLGHVFYSGIGGQVDFMRGAARSKMGRPIIALPSTAQNGRVSRIVPQLSEGSSVTTTRGDVHYVVTEYGIAELRGKTVMQRALALINIAHPKFRAGLLEYAKNYGYIHQEQPETPYKGHPYPGRYETTRFFESTPVLFRPVKPTDEDMMREMFYTFSDRSIYQRFMGAKKRLTLDELHDFVNVDYWNRMAIAAFVKEGERCKMIAVGAYFVDPAASTADINFIVIDEWQNKGIGTFMMDMMIQIGRDRGLKGFVADVMVNNAIMRDIFYRSGLEVKTTLMEDEYHITMDLTPKVKIDT